MEHVSSMGKIQKERMLFTGDSKMSYGWKLLNRWNQWVHLIQASIMKVVIY